MPLEMGAIVSAFHLASPGDSPVAPHGGEVGGSSVTAVHMGMGPARTRHALARILDANDPAYGRWTT